LKPAVTPTGTLVPVGVTVEPRHQIVGNRMRRHGSGMRFRGSDRLGRPEPRDLMQRTSDQSPASTGCQSPAQCSNPLRFRVQAPLSRRKSSLGHTTARLRAHSPDALLGERHGAATASRTSGRKSYRPTRGRLLGHARALSGHVDLFQHLNLRF
jgi:hypothetical protein